MLRLMPFSVLFAALFAALLSTSASAFSLSDLSQQDASAGLKDALTQGAEMAVKELSAPGGFSDNKDVRIELPGNLGKASRTLKMMGMGGQITQLEDSMNKAAEAAVPQAQTLKAAAATRFALYSYRWLKTPRIRLDWPSNTTRSPRRPQASVWLIATPPTLRVM